MSLHVSATTGCNLGCSYCYENPSRERKQQWVDRQYDIEKIMDQLREWKDKYPHERPGLHGGEPLLVRAEHLERIFAYMDENWDSDAQHIQTNGTLMTEEHIEIFEEYNVHVGISCDGPLELNRERKAAGERDADESGKPTDNATEKTLEAIEMCKEADVSFGIITVLHERNAGTDGRLERLLDWMDGICASGGGGHWNPAIPYEDINDDEDVSLDPSRLKEVYLRGWEWMKAETYRSWGPMNSYVDNLLGNQVKNCVNGKCDVANAGAAKIIKGNGESTGCGKTWGQYGDGGAFLQGPSTGNNYDDSEERYDALKQTPGWVTDDAPDMGGCKGCKFWNVCSGGCPSAGGDDNYRNRTVWCEAKYALYEAVERDLRALMPNIRLITDLPWDAEVNELASSRQLDFKPFAAVRPDSPGKSAAMGGADHNEGAVERHVPDDRLPDDAWEREVKKIKEKYPAEDLVINESEQKWHADSDQ